MTDRTTSPTPTVANDDGPSLARGKCVHRPTRELAQRLSGTVEILLLWHPEIERVELSVRDPATDAGFHFEVAPGNAIDAFYHPYAYAARRENFDAVDRAETMILDG
jgi:hypothetical protein